jgi:hypothetical protein
LCRFGEPLVKPQGPNGADRFGPLPGLFRQYLEAEVMFNSPTEAGDSSRLTPNSEAHASAEMAV